MKSYGLKFIFIFTGYVKLVFSIDAMFIGCYESHDPNGTAIFSGSKFSEVVNQMYLNNCTDFCYTSNSTFAGLYGWIWKRCVCGLEDELNTNLKSEDSWCNSNCFGDLEYGCGGFRVMAVYQLFGVSTTKNDMISSTRETALTTKMYTIQSSDEIMTPTVDSSHFEETTAPWTTRLERNITNIEQRLNFSIKTTVPPSIREETNFTNITYSLETTEPSSTNYVNKGIADVTNEPTLFIETTQWYTSNLPLKNCKCPCHTINSKWKNILHSNISQQEIIYLIEEEVKEIQKEIVVDKTATNAYLRRKSSATDKRTSSVTVGILAVIIIVLVLMFFVCFDCVSVYQKINN